MNKTKEIQQLELICSKVKVLMLNTLLNAGTGHLGGLLSSAELMTTLYFGKILKFDPLNPQHPHRDRVLVRGHLGPLRYSIFSLIGWLKESDLPTYRKLHSRLQGHEAMELVSGVDITPSGSLGMLLSYGVGCAYALTRQKSPAKVYVFLGDGEEQEGNVSEAARHASHIGLTNLVCLIDKNKKQLSRPTNTTDNGTNLKMTWQGYGWHVKEIKNGHSISEIILAFNTKIRTKPLLLIANTEKGHGLSGAKKHPSGYHTLRTCPKEYVEYARSREENRITGVDINKIARERIEKIERPEKDTDIAKSFFTAKIRSARLNDIDEEFAHYFHSLVNKLKKRPEIHLYSMTADWTVQSIVKQCGFDHKHINYIDVGIKEQHLLSMAHGLAVTDKNSIILVVCGDCFILRAGDQLNAISQANSRIIIAGTDSGLCETVNGATHQSAGQPGALINMPGLKMLEPADSIDLISCLNWAINKATGPVYLRLHSGAIDCMPIDDKNRNIKAYVAFNPKSRPKAIIATSGLPINGAIELAQELDIQKLGIKVINIIDAEGLDCQFVKMLGEKIPVLVVYNGNPAVLQSYVAQAVMKYDEPRPSIIIGHGFVKGTTGRLDELLKFFQLDKEGLKNILQKTFPQIF